MKLGWLAAILACEVSIYAFLTRKWHRAALGRLAETADTFAPMPDMVAFITVHLMAAGVGLFFASKTSTWFMRVVVFVAFFWVTAKPLRFISLVAVVRYAGISPAHVLQMVPTPEAQRDRTIAFRAEALQLMDQLKLDEETRWKLKTMTLLGKWVDEQEHVTFLKFVLKQDKVLNRDTLEAELQEFRIQSLDGSSDMPS
jgi:hypothetical protein